MDQVRILVIFIKMSSLRAHTRNRKKYISTHTYIINSFSLSLSFSTTQTHTKIHIHTHTHIHSHMHTNYSSKGFKLSFCIFSCVWVYVIMFECIYVYKGASVCKCASVLVYVMCMSVFVR